MPSMPSTLETQKFTPLPTNDSIPFSHGVDFHLKHNPTWPYAVLVPPEDEGDAITITWMEFARAVHRGADIVNPIIDGSPSIGPKKVVAIIAVVDSLVYQTIVLSILRSGNIPFPISNRNTVASIVHLLKATSCHYLIVGGGSAISALGTQVHQYLDAINHTIQVIDIPGVKELFPELGHESPKRLCYLYPGDARHAIRCGPMLHSSGSTGLPKPIHLNDAYMKTRLNTSFIRNLPSSLIHGVATLPPFHAMGFEHQILYSMLSGVTVALWAPKDLPTPSTPETTLRSFQKAKCTMGLAVPSFLISWNRDPVAVEYLSSMKYLLTGGGPLPQDTGDELIRNGVPIVPSYGGTEFGAITKLNSEIKTPDEWSWLEFMDEISVHLEPQPGDPQGTCELHIIDTDNYHVAVHNATSKTGPVYQTSDLFVPHPTIRGLWKIVGRLDDQITLATGEKVNPAPIQDIIVENSMVNGVVLFGRAKNQVGLLVEPKEQYAFDPADKDKLAKFRNAIWPSVESANRTSAGFARIFKEAILPTVVAKPLPRTPKGTVSIKGALKLYEAEINVLYNTLEIASANDFPSPASWREADLKSWLTRALMEILEREVDPERDIFEQGGDSLTATFLRSRVVGAMRRAGDPTFQEACRDVGQNLVYAHPTVVSLAKHIASLVYSSRPSPVDLFDKTVREINTLINRYTASLPLDHLDSRAPASPPRSETIVLTGSTGALGSFLLAQLLADERVQKIWALNRVVPISGRTVMQRQWDSFLNKGLDASLLHRKHPKVVFLEANLADNHLGLEESVYEEICSTSTLIIHNAWRVDFNLTVASFEPLIKGTRNVIDLALRSPHVSRTRVLFTSSVGAVGGWSDISMPVPEEPICDPHLSVSIGYGEAKFVSERILEEASRRTGLQTANLRIGQMSGGGNGFWSVTDWIPIIIASSIHLGCLPDAVGTVSWVPMNLAASTILDIAFRRDEPLEQTLHIFHPHPVKWRSVFEAFSVALGPISGGSRLPLVPFSDWFSKLESFSPQDASRIPALKLLEFFRSSARGDDELRSKSSAADRYEALSSVLLSTRKAVGVSPTLRDLPSLGDDDVSRWVAYWRSQGLFTPASDSRR